jgi:hypothetical protein
MPAAAHPAATTPGTAAPVPFAMPAMPRSGRHMGEFSLGFVESRKIDGIGLGLVRNGRCRQSGSARRRGQAADQDGQK